MARLLIDTSTARCAVFARTDKGDFEDLEPGSRGQDARLAPMVQGVLKAADLYPKDITDIGVIIGPGAFTGVRIGVAFARAFGLALDRPVTGINALDVFAQGSDQYCAGVCDIGRGELAYRLCKDGQLQGGYETGLVDEVSAKIRAFGDGHKVHLAGSGAALIGDDVLYDGAQNTLSLRRVTELLEAGALPDQEALPWYHRAPDAKLPGGITP